MGKVSKAVEHAKKTAELLASKRPYRTHYSGGMHVGAASTPIGAAVAGFRHLLLGECGNCQIVNPDGTDAMRMGWTSSGVTIWAPPSAFERPTKIITPVERAEKEAAKEARAAGRPKLQRVK